MINSVHDMLIITENILHITLKSHNIILIANHFLESSKAMNSLYQIRNNNAFQPYNW